MLLKKVTIGKHHHFWQHPKLWPLNHEWTPALSVTIVLGEPFHMTCYSAIITKPTIWLKAVGHVWHTNWEKQRAHNKENLNVCCSLWHIQQSIHIPLLHTLSKLAHVLQPSCKWAGMNLGETTYSRQASESLSTKSQRLMNTLTSLFTSRAERGLKFKNRYDILENKLALKKYKH